LIVEEVCRPGETTGGLEHYVKGKWWHAAKLGKQKEGFTYRAFEKYLTTVTEHGTLRLRNTVNRDGTIELLVTLYQWWTDGWDAHQSLLGLDKSTQARVVEQERKERGGGVSFFRTPPSLARRVAAELPGIGAGKSKQVAEHFGTVAAMVEAGPKEWQEVRGIGKKVAAEVTAALKGTE
jgi:ERCC4-type nuclease